MSAASTACRQSPGCQPTFLGIGAHRCGTTWLYEHLGKHPDCWLPPIKELHYFDRSPQYASNSELTASRLRARLAREPGVETTRAGACLARSIGALATGDLALAAWWLRWGFGNYDDDWYQELFRPGIDRPCRGEITPSYALLTDKDVAAIRQLFPNLKLVLMVRNPKSRAWSSLRYWAASGGPDLSEQTVRRTLQRPGFLERGDYVRILDTYLAHFPPNQILVGFYDAIVLDPRGLLDGISEFLGLSAYPAELISNSAVNPAPAQDIHPAIDRILDETFEPTMADIQRRLGSYASRWDSAAKENYENLGAADLPATIHPLPGTRAATRQS